MLSISPIANISYYSNLAEEDYYLDDGEPQGEWAGLGSRVLELSATVDNEHYRNIYQGKSPCGEYALRQFQDVNQKQRAGWDLTFSAPKSISVAWARADSSLKHKIQLAHKLAVLQAVSTIEDKAAFTRKCKSGKAQEQVLGIVASIFEHSTSRAQDPQLHTHCLIANVAPRLDGSWGTIDSKHLYDWKMAIGAAYRAELAKQLIELGFNVEADKDAFKLSQIPQHLVDFYSKRTKEIEAELNKRGISNSSSKTGDIATLATRTKKSEIVRADLYKLWSKELNQLGFSQSDLTNLIAQDNSLFITPEASEPLSQELLSASLSESKSTFTEQEIYRQACVLAQYSGEGTRQATKVAKEFLRNEKTIILSLDRKNRQLYTTKEILNLENEMISKAQKLASRSNFSINPSTIEQFINSNSFELTEEQQESIYHASSQKGLGIIQGSAGAGKSASMNTVRKIYQSAGYKVIGASLAKSAANNLAQEANIETFTIAKLLKDSNKIDLSNSVLLIDEAGQVSSKDMLKLIDLAHSNNSKLILVGEDKQLDAIEHGGTLKYLSQPQVIGTTRIESIRRQNENWAKQIVADFRDGKAEDALWQLDNKGLLNIYNSSEELKEILVDKWAEFKQQSPNKNAIILAQRWEEVFEINSRARRKLQELNLLDNNEIELNCKVGEKQVTQKFSVGEKVRLTKNDYRLGLTNGEQGYISKIVSSNDESFSIQVDFENGQSKVINTNEYSDKDKNLYLIQAYAMTVYSSQGLTIDGDSFVYYTTSMDRANTYVACSRHKDRSHLFINKNEIEELVTDRDSAIHKDKAFIKVLANKMSSNEKAQLATELYDSQADKITSNRKEHDEIIELTP